MGSAVRDGRPAPRAQLAVGDPIEILAAWNSNWSRRVWRRSEVIEAGFDWFRAKVVDRVAPTTFYTYHYAEENVTWRRVRRRRFVVDAFAMLGVLGGASFLLGVLLGGLGLLLAFLLAGAFAWAGQRHARRCASYDCWRCGFFGTRFLAAREIVNGRTTVERRRDN